MKVFAAIGFVFALMLGTGSASAVTYSFADGNPNASLFTLGCAAGGLLNTSCAVTYGPNGAGVNGSGGGNIPDTDPGNIDSFPIASFETLLITFNQPFTLLALELGNFTPFVDDFEYSVNGDAFSSAIGFNPISFGSGILASTLAIRASSFNPFDLFLPDSFTLKSISGVAAVPVPAGIALLGSALGALGLVGWRKRRAQAA